MTTTMPRVVATLGLLIYSMGATAGELLFVSATNPATASDKILISHLQGRGHTVAVVADEAVTSADDIGKQLIVISSSVSSGRVADTFRFSNVPVITWEAWLYDDMGMTGPEQHVDYGRIFNEEDVTVAGNHSLTALHQGPVQVSTVPTSLEWGIPGADAVVSAHVKGNPAIPLLFSYEDGAVMFDGIAPARRVGIFLDDSISDTWTGDARTLFDAAVDWALGPTSNQPPDVDAGTASTVPPSTPVALDGRVSDDFVSLPLSFVWSVEAAPSGGSVQFDDASGLRTEAVFSTPGVYTLKLTVNDGEHEVLDTVAITVDDEASGTQEVLFVGKSPINQADSLIINRLVGQGHSVVFVPDSTVSSADAAGKSIILVSSTTWSGHISTKFTNTPVPLIIWEAYAFDDLGLTGSGAEVDFGTVTNQTAINVVGSSPLTAGLSGTTQIATVAQQIRWGRPGASAIVAATVSGDASRATLFAYDAGAQMTSFTAPARRVALYLDDDTAEVWSAQSASLFDAAFAWASGGSVINQPPEVDAGSDRTVTVNVQTTLDGSVNDDGIAGPLTILWSVLQTPPGGSAIIDDLADPKSAVTFTLDGTYVLELEVDDTEFSDTDQVTFTVTDSIPSREILYVSSSNPADPDDQQVLFHLRTVLGHNVEVADDDLVTTSDASGKDLVMVSVTSSSGKVNTKFRDTALPVMVWEPYLLDDMGMTLGTPDTDYGMESDQTVISVVGGGHQLAAGKVGATTITSAARPVRWGRPLAGAITVATVDGASNRATIFGYEQGAALHGVSAPARRLSFFIDDTSGNALTADAKDLLDAAVSWLLGTPSDSQFRILPLGDSITRGDGQVWSYRQALSSLLAADQCRFDYVGTLWGADTNPSGPGLFDRDHEGHGGFRTDQIANGLSNWLPGNVPDEVLVHLGTNDISQGANLVQSKEHLRNVIQQLRAFNPGVRIFLGQIIPRGDSLASVVPTWNNMVADLAAEENTGGSPVMLIDQFTGYDSNLHNQPDGIHPNSDGDALIANKWFGGLRPLIDDHCAP